MNSERRNELIEQCRIDSLASLQSAIEKMDQIGRKLLIVFKNKKYLGLLSIGDIQRALIKEFDLTTSVEKAMRPQQKVSDETATVDDIKKRIFELRAEFMPVVSVSGELTTVYFWEEFFSKSPRLKSHSLNCPVVIMAGGKGSRLKPITNVIPKPLVPLGKRPIVEEIIDRFYTLGVTRFHLSVNYKAEMIKQYFESIEDRGYEVSYFQEPKPLGTAGSLSLIKDQLNEAFFVSNCDILVEEDYSEVKKHHDDSKNDLTIVAVMKNYDIPYGTLNVTDNCELIDMKEKPRMSFLINSGMYIVEPHLLKLVPDDRIYHITELIAEAKSRGHRIGVFPVSERSWIDIGQWSEYLKTVGVYDSSQQV